MKTQIRRLSPHQNGKVFGILMAVNSLIFILPISLLVTLFPPAQQSGVENGHPGMFLLIMPVFYLIFGYISVAIGCLIYNFFYRFIGGIELDIVDIDD